jgi:dTDP-4-dehydrorhamnose reductase
MRIRLVQISSDCVFSGLAGNYTESSPTDAYDLYGKSKALGEITDQDHCLTLRTSTIGHEINTKNGLLEWFLSQHAECRGFSRAIFSGLTTIELAKVLRVVLLTKPNLSGLYNIAAESISKYDLLRLIANVYGKKIHIVRDDQYIIDRSLSAEKFYKHTGYIAPSWISMIEDMFKSKNNV